MSPTRTLVAGAEQSQTGRRTDTAGRRARGCRPARRARRRDRRGDQRDAAADGGRAANGVGVLREAEQLCTSLRGVQKFGAKSVTSALDGVVCDDPRTGQEFLALTTRTDHA